MPDAVRRQISFALMALAIAGCQQQPFGASAQTPQGPPPQQVAMLQQQQEIASRTSALDADNQELQAKLAQAQQQNRTLQDRLGIAQDSLNSTMQLLTQAKDAQQSAEQQAQVLAASAQRRSAAMISANNSLTKSLPVINLPGVEVRQDGDVVRIEMPADKLFNPGTAQIRQDATPILDSVAGEVQRAYPNQIVGVEGHTDSDPPQQGTWLSNHQLSTARAGAVLDYLVGRRNFRPQQVFVVGHGGNHPVVSNATPQGKARNRRVELVVYPETWTK